jgi:hypothetical protein
MDQARHRVRARVCIVTCLFVFALAGWGASTVAAAPLQSAQRTAATCFFPKTKFLFHAGLAFGAFHRYIYKPYKAGTFTGSGKVAAIAKAALASVFVYHEIHEAQKQVSCSHTLQVLESPLTKLMSVLKAAETKLKAGSLPNIAALGRSFDAIGTQAGGLGLTIKDIAHGI